MPAVFRYVRASAFSTGSHGCQGWTISMDDKTRDSGSATDVSAMVRAASTGDQRSWDGLHDQFKSMVWSIARAHGLSAADAADVSQTTWTRLVEHVDRIKQPEYVGAWLATTARRESLRVLRVSGRQIPTPDDVLLDRPSIAADPPDNR